MCNINTCVVLPSITVHVDDNGSVQIDPADGEQIEITVIKEDGTHSTGYKV